jgi:uncharacterized protein
MLSGRDAEDLGVRGRLEIVTVRFCAPLLALTLWQAGVTSAAAQPAPPKLTDPVNDFARVIDASSRAELERRIRALDEATEDAVVIATVPTFKPYGSIDEYAVKMFENGGRGIGRKGKDNGLLIVVAVQDRTMRIEVGYDLEGIVPDSFAGDVRDTMRQKFRAGRYGEGLLSGTTALINRISEKRGVPVPDVPAEGTRKLTRSSRGFPIGTVFWIILIMILVSRGNRPRRRRYWGGGPWSGWTGGVGGFGGGGFGGGGFGGGGGGGGGGFGGFGGGRSGGGGASGSW